MADEQSIAVILADSAEVARVGLATERERVLQLGATPIVEAITGLFASGKWGAVVVGAGLCTERSNSSFFSRCPKKSKSCVRKEKSPTSLPRRSDAFNSWVELFTVIANETPDEDRLEALKAMFYSVNKINATEGEIVANYQLFQIARKLTSDQFLYLRASYELFNANDFRRGETANTRDWLGKIGKKLGHDVIGLLDQDDLALIGHGLLRERLYADKSGIVENDAHMTPLGIKFCKTSRRIASSRSTNGGVLSRRRI